jgi:hypothetical protein
VAEQPKPAPDRSALNAVASVRAAQEQMQGDVDKLRKDVQALLVLTLYVVGALAVTYFAVKGRGAG